MPISENELMWSRSLPEEVEVEADRAEVVAGALAEGSGQQHAAESGEEPTESKPVVRVEATSGLEATLARLEMNSLAIKLHLEDLEERIGRLQPHAQPTLAEDQAQSLSGLVPAKAMAEGQSVPHDGEAGRESPPEPALSQGAKEKRWSHLIGPELDELMAMEAPSAAEAPRMLAPAKQGVGQPTAGVPVQAAGDAQTRAPIERPMRMSAAAERSGEQLGSPLITGPASLAEPRPQSTASSPASAAAGLEIHLPVTVTSRGAGPASEAGLPKTPQTDAYGHGAAQLAPEPIGGKPPLAGDPSQANASETRGPLPTKPMFSSFGIPNQEPAPAAAGPKMWRGYRVRRLVWALVLLVLAAIPLAIWWGLSTEARDIDAGDAGPVSRVDQGAAGLRSEKPSAGEGSIPASRRMPARVLGEAASSTKGANAGMVRGSAVAPVVRRSPSEAERMDSTASGDTRGLGSTLQPSSRVAVAPALGGQPGGADEVPGTSALRVRVPESVMAGHLLPTGDVGELPRASGEVTAAVYISNTGRVEEVEVISGAQALRHAAMRAIRNWRYEPYVQAGVRVPVLTTASIRFGGETAEAP